MKPLKLEDPLVHFNWEALYQRYDESTRSSKFISCLKYLDFQPSPKSDRDLYDHILEALRKNNNVLTIDIYSAIIYWKMYSVSVSTNKKLVSNNAFRQNAAQSLQKFQKVADLNKITERNPDKIIQLMEWLKIELYGVGYRVASTICHFMWPNIVPIVDRMVFRAIGNGKDESNAYADDMDYVKRYIEHNWVLSDRYSPVFPSHLHETPVRLIDMSLWVIR